MSLSNNCLENVILRFDFKDEVLISADIVENVKNNFISEFNYEYSQRLDVNIILNQDKLAAKNRIMDVHTFKNKSGFTISLEPGFILFNSENYSSYSEFITIIKKFIAILQIGDENLKRFGLRYINNIKLSEGDPYKWEGYINPELTQIKNFVNTDEFKYLSRNMGNLFFKKTHEDLDFSLQFIYGWPNSEFPNPIAKKEFVLDYDCFTESHFRLNEALGYIDIFHSEIKKMFIRSIGEDLKNKIGEDKLWVE